MNIVIIGAGMYVCGRGTDGYGTILPALAECQRDGLVDSLSIAARNPSSISSLQTKLGELNNKLGTDISISEMSTEAGDSNSYQKIVSGEHDIDAAIIVTPDHTHTEIAKMLIEAGIHCLVVKPLAPTLSEAEELVQLAESKNVYGSVEFHKRWDESNLHVKSLLREDKLGDMLYTTVEYSQRKMIPSEVFKSWSAQTNIFQYLGVHYVDIISFATGAEPRRVSAVGQKNWLASNGIDTWDSIQAVIEWESTSGKLFHSVFALNWVDPDSSSSMSDQRILFVGTKGRCECDQKRRGMRINTDADGLTEPNPYFSEFLPEGDVARFRGYGYRSIRQFIEDVSSIKSGTNKPGDFEDIRPTFRAALPSTAVVDAVNRSLNSNGEWIDVPAGLAAVK